MIKDGRYDIFFCSSDATDSGPNFEFFFGVPLGPPKIKNVQEMDSMLLIKRSS
jgi:hypothetical protein